MKGIVSCLFSRLMLGIVLIILQFGWIFFSSYRVTAISNGINILLHILSVIVSLCVVNREHKSYARLSWVFLILSLPILGIPVYFFFGMNVWGKKQLKQLCEKFSESTNWRLEDDTIREQIKNSDIRAFLQSEYITRVGGYPVCQEQESEYFRSGEDTFAQILKDIQSAEKYVFLEFYILHPGKMLDTMMTLLEQKIADGVQVRLIYDELGCVQTLPLKYCRKLQEKGFRIAGFQSVRPSLCGLVNHRDHRKILIVDGKIAYTGGLNLADEYINEISRFGYWKDEAIRITGKGAWNFTTMFLDLWNYILDEQEDYSPLCPKVEYTDSGFLEKGVVQPFSVSPFDGEAASENIYLNMIRQATKYVYIFTPYLIIGEEMEQTLINAARCGVDVRIVTPGIPDKKLVYLMTQYNYLSLIRGGVRIYQYTPGFLHSKCILADDKYAIIGSINMDYRSFHLLFESGVFLYHASAVWQLKEDMMRTLGVSQEVVISECRKKIYSHRFVLSILRLFAPLL